MLMGKGGMGAVGGMEVRLALVEQSANVGHHRRVVGQFKEQRIIRQQ